MIKLQPWTTLKGLFGYSTHGHRPATIAPAELKNYVAALPLYDDTDPAVGWYSQHMKLTSDRVQLYKEYDQMDSDDWVCAILDMMAEEACPRDTTTGKMIWFEAQDPEIERMGNDLLDKIAADVVVYGIAREVAKYGDSYAGLVQAVRDDGTPGGIIGILPASPYIVSRKEDEDARLQGFKIGDIAGASQVSSIKMSPAQELDPPWSIVHFRLSGNSRSCPYGTSLFYPARRPFRRVRMVEDSVLLYKIKRAPDRMIVGIKGLDGMSVEERQNVMRKIKQELKKRTGIDPTTGTLKQEMDPLAVDEDLVIDENAVTVSMLRGSQNSDQIMSLEYFRKRFLGVIGVPPDYLGFEDTKSGFDNGQSLCQQDINYARKIKRIQSAVMEGFSQIFQIHMAWCGIDPLSAKAKFTCHMNPASALDEKQRLELEKIRVDTVATLEQLGSALGVEGDQWVAYLLQQSKLPLHLFRQSGKEDNKLLRGKIDVVTEGLKNSTTLTETAKKVAGLPHSERYKVEALITKVQKVFGPQAGPNAFHSRCLAETFGPDVLRPMKTYILAEEWKNQKPAIEAEVVSDRPTNLMEAVTRRLIAATEQHTASVLEQEQKELEEAKQKARQLNG